MGVKTTVL